MDITSGLKRVTKDQQTWRAEYKADDKAAPPPPKPTAKAASPAPRSVAKGPRR
jgi:hypothetical protein